MKICETDIKMRGRLVRIAYPELEKYELLDNPQAVIDGLRSSRTRIDLFTFMQIKSDNAPEYPYARELDNMAMLRLSTFEDWWKQLRSEARNRARQAGKKGVKVLEVAFDEILVQGIWQIYNETAIRQGKPNAHFGKDLETVRKEEATFLDRSIFIGAFLGDELIGFVKLVMNKDRTHANLMNIVSMVKHRDKAPTNALIAQSVRSCSERGIRDLAYQAFTYGNRGIDSLTNFKEVNGFQRINLPRYYVPLTPLGSVVLRLGLHRSFVDYLPSSFVNWLRDLRTSWYKRKLVSVT